MDRSKTIQNISKALGNVNGIEKIILFGSSARGDYDSDSDIDLLVLISDSLSVYNRIEREKEISGILLDLELKSGIEISPVILQPKVWNQRKTPFTVNVMNEGIVL